MPFFLSEVRPRRSVGNPRPTVIGLLTRPSRSPAAKRKIPVVPAFEHLIACRSRPNLQNFPIPVNDLRPAPKSGRKFVCYSSGRKGQSLRAALSFCNAGLQTCQESFLCAPRSSSPPPVTMDANPTVPPPRRQGPHRQRQPPVRHLRRNPSPRLGTPGRTPGTQGRILRPPSARFPRGALSPRPGRHVRVAPSPLPRGRGCPMGPALQHQPPGLRRVRLCPLPRRPDVHPATAPDQLHPPRLPHRSERARTPRSPRPGRPRRQLRRIFAFDQGSVLTVID